MTITEGALFFLSVHGTAALSPGTVFTAIDNTVATPINGTFSNLPDGGIVSVNGNKLQVDYEGRDGNDLTLTAVQ